MTGIPAAHRSRGRIAEADLRAYAHLNPDALVSLAGSTTAAERTIAVRLLSTYFPPDARPWLDLLLDMLAKEKSLYTRLAICDALAQGGLPAAARMLPQLGRIGHNQHKTVPPAPSKKASFPLPRDLIARTLGRMGADVLPFLVASLPEAMPPQLPELLDAIGYLATRHAGHAQVDGPAIRILDVYHAYPENALVRWKCVLCLSAFPTPASQAFLRRLIHDEPDGALRREAARSLRQLQR